MLDRSARLCCTRRDFTHEPSAVSAGRLVSYPGEGQWLKASARDSSGSTRSDSLS